MPFPGDYAAGVDAKRSTIGIKVFRPNYRCLTLSLSKPQRGWACLASLSSPGQYEDLFSYWRGEPGVHRRSQLIFSAQLERWKKFRRFQQKNRRYFVFHNKFPEYQQEVLGRRRRHGLDGDVQLLEDLPYCLSFSVICVISSFLQNRSKEPESEQGTRIGAGSQNRSRWRL